MMNGNNNFQMYQNSGYINNRNRKRTLILDVDDVTDDNLGTTGTFKVALFEPLIIDKHSEVYLDNFTSYNSNLASDLDLAAFSLKINEFTMNSNVASTKSNQSMFNALVIPNEHRNPDNYQTSVIHKGKKFNYVCDINPGTIHSLSGKITDLGGSPAFHGSSGTGVYTYTIIGIDPSKISRSGGKGQVITQSTGFTSVTGISGLDPITGTFLVTTNLDTTTTLHFSTNTKITTVGEVTPLSANFHTNISGEATGTGTGAGNEKIEFTIGAGDILTIDNATPDNPSMTIIEGHGRFIAEFSIISRE